MLLSWQAAKKCTGLQKIFCWVLKGSRAFQSKALVHDPRKSRGGLTCRHGEGLAAQHSNKEQRGGALDRHLSLFDVPRLIQLVT